MNTFTPRVDVDILNSLRFYFMLGIVLTDRGETESIACESLNSFLKELRKDQYINETILNYHFRIAYRTIPSDFLRLYNVEINGDDRNIKIVEEYHAPSGR